VSWWERVLVFQGANHVPAPVVRVHPGTPSQSARGPDSVAFSANRPRLTPAKSAGYGYFGLKINISLNIYLKQRVSRSAAGVQQPQLGSQPSQPGGNSRRSVPRQAGPRQASRHKGRASPKPGPRLADSRPKGKPAPQWPLAPRGQRHHGRFPGRTIRPCGILR